MFCYKCQQLIEKKETAYHGLHPSCFSEWFEIHDDILAPNFTNLVLKTTSTNSVEGAIPRSSFFHGKFKKYSAMLGDKAYILKVKEPQCPELPATEYLCNQLLNLFNLPIPPFYFIKLNNEIDAFITQNFMHELVGNLTHFYHYLSAHQKFNCANISEIIGKTSQQPYVDLKNFAMLCLFDALIGNHDRHGRNLGFIQTAERRWLAPFYDNVSYLAVEDEALLGAMHEPRGSIHTEQSMEPSLKDYVREFKRLNIEVTSFYEQIDLAKIFALINQAFISEARKRALISLIERRYLELKQELFHG